MNDFKGMSKATSWVKTPSDMWHFARNILLTSQYLSIANEKGNEYGYSIPGRVIGYCVTNEDIVYLSIDNGYTCIGYVNYLNEVYVPVLRTINPYFKFKHSCPIECVSVYNYKKELIIIFSDGVFADSSTPKLINIHRPQAALTSTKEFVNANDYTMFELFSPVNLPLTSVRFEAGNLRAEVIYLAFCYVYEDDTEGIISPVLSTDYPTFKGINPVRKKVIYTLDKLSSSFSKIKLFFVVQGDGSTQGYSTPILNIVNGKVEFSFNTITNLDIVAPEQILISTARFSKVKTLTKVDNQLLVGNIEQANISNLQKYANKLVLALDSVLDKDYIDKYKTYPSLMPDEVYSVKLVPIYTDGTKGNALHIPGRTAIGNERDILSDSDLASIGLDFDTYKNKGYRRFHIYNTGNPVSYPPKFGYWENEDVYPNKDYYNSSDIEGEDLRGKPVRYHRIPEVVKTGVSESFGAIASGEFPSGIGINNKYFLRVTNFESVFPLEIRNKLQGYELVIEKRQLSSTYVETNGFLYQANVLAGPTRNTDTIAINVPNQFWRRFTDACFVSAETARDTIDINATLIKCYYGVPAFNELNENVKTFEYYNPSSQGGSDYPPPVLSNYTLGTVTSASYKKANNIVSNNRFQGETLQLTIKEKHTGKIVPDRNSPSTPQDPDLLGYYDVEDFVPISVVPIDPNYKFMGLNILYASLITLNKNIYNLESANEFISLGTVSLKKQSLSNHVFIGGDVFTTNIIKKTMTGVYNVFNGTTEVPNGGKIYNLYVYNLYNMYAPFSNHYIENGIAFRNFYTTAYPEGQRDYDPNTGDNQYKDWKTDDVNRLNSFNYETVIKASSVSNYFNTYVEALPPSLTEKYVTYFPYRVYKGLDIPTESLQTNNLRFFPTNSYYDMPNDRGDIVALRGYNRGVYIQQRWSLFQSVITDKIASNELEVYLGSSTLFDRTPQEVVDNSNVGYIGSNSQFACFVFRDGYVTVNEEAGEVFIVNSEMSEISKQNMGNAFRSILPLGTHYMKQDLKGNKVKVDNPFLSAGYLVGFDKENNRILVTKKYYNPRTLTRLMNFDGEFYRDTNGNILDFDDPNYFYNESRTFSFALDSKTWVCEHDYFPNAYLYNNKGLFGIKNTSTDAKFYTFNSNNVNNGNFFGVQYESYVDLIFSTRLDLSKQYQALYWVSESVDNLTGQMYQFKTIDKVMLYNYHQCSGIIETKPENFSTVRNVESKWQFNEFRDMLVSTETKFLKDDGTFIPNSIVLNKVWYEQNLFISNFIVARLIWSNADNRTTYVHNVNIKSINSSR